jgi:pSer/pThr/pTyr-binding forkhead associated (FHA) protein
VAAAGQRTIIVKAPNGDSRDVVVGRAAVVLGRDDSADVRVDDKKVSRRHASFRVVDGEVWVEDLGSSNGVRLNGKRIEKRARLGPGDEVRVGAFVVMLSEREPAPEASRVEVEAAPVGTAPVRRVIEKLPDEREFPLLVGLDGPVEGKRFILRRGENVLGRLEECDVPILDASVSRQHARVVFARERVTVTDLGSSNGVFVNDERIDVAELADGDRLRIGNVPFAVRLPPALAEVARQGNKRVQPARPQGSPRRRVVLAAVALFAAAFAVTILVFWKLRGQVVPERMSSAYAGAQPARPGALDAATPFAASARADRDASSPVASDAGAQPEPSAPEAPTAELTQARRGSADASTAPDALSPAVAAPPAPPLPVRPAPPAIVASSPALLAGTATSPFSRRGPDGLPVGLPIVDPGFDFDGFVAEKLAAAKRCAAAPDPACVERLVAELLARDPINAEARALRARISSGQRADQALREAEALLAKNEFAAALRLLRAVPADAPKAEAAAQRASQIQQLAIDEELTRARKEAEVEGAWPRAHQRFTEVLALDASSIPALEGLRELEKKMRARSLPFRAYEPGRPPAAEPGPAPGRPAPPPKALASDTVALVAAHYPGQPELAKIAETYARGALPVAKKLAADVTRRGGAKGAGAAKLLTALDRLERLYQRTRAEVSNNPQQAWSMLLQLTEAEAQLLPRKIKSYAVRELEVSLSEAFAGQGSSFLEEQRLEEAFSRFESAFKLDATNPKALAGLRSLEERAKKEVGEAELALQRGERDVCARWQRITRLTRAGSEVHDKARAKALQLCP